MASIYKDQNNSWMVEIRKKGYPRVRQSFDTKTKATYFAAQTEAAMKDGTYKTEAQVQAEVEAKQRNSITLKAAGKKYLAEVSAEKTAKSVETESTVFSQLEAAGLSDLLITEVTSSHINDFKKFLKKRRNKNATINRKLTVLNHMFNVAKDWHIESLNDNPVEGSKERLGAGGGRRSRTFKGDEEAVLMTALDGCLNEYIKLIVQFALETGMRRREILESQWLHVKLDHPAYIHLPAPITKTRIARDVPLSPKAVEVLRKVRKMHRGNKVFPVSKDAFKGAWAKTQARSGIEDFQFRDCRHVALTRLSKIYPRAQDLARISGHEKLDTLLTYYEVDVTEQAEIMSDYFK